MTGKAMSIRNIEGAKKGTIYTLPYETIYVEEGFNIRASLNEEHVEDLKNAYLRGDAIPPIDVTMTERGAQVVHGHHRYEAFGRAIKEGMDSPGMKVIQCSGNSEQSVCHMINSQNSLPLGPLDRANAYSRLAGWGWSSKDIAEKIGRSVSDVDKYLLLANAPMQMRELIAKEEVAASTAIEYVRAHGDNAVTVLKEHQAKAKSNPGKAAKPSPQSAKKPKFPAKKSHRILELLIPHLRAEPVERGSDTWTLTAKTLPASEHVELNDLIEDYLYFVGEQVDEQEEVEASQD